MANFVERKSCLLEQVPGLAAAHTGANVVSDEVVFEHERDNIVQKWIFLIPTSNIFSIILRA